MGYTKLIADLRQADNLTADHKLLGVCARADAAIEALQAEVQFYNALAEEWKSAAENKERLLGLYRAEQAKNFYSAIDDNGRIIANPCACMNIPIFPNGSESPNSQHVRNIYKLEEMHEYQPKR